MKLRITILKYHSWYLFQTSLQIMLLPIQIIFDPSQRQQNHNTTTDKKSCHFFFHLDNISRGFCLWANDFAGNRPRDFCRGACVDIFRQWGVWLQLIFCTCVKETVLFSFLRSLLRKNGRSLRFPRIFIKKTNSLIEW